MKACNVKKLFIVFVNFVVAILITGCAPPLDSSMAITNVATAKPTPDNDLGSFLVALEAQRRLDTKTACDIYFDLLEQPPRDIPFKNLMEQALPSLLGCGKIRQAAKLLQEKSLRPLATSPLAAVTIMSDALAQGKPSVPEGSLQAPYPELLLNRIAAYWNYQALRPKEVDQKIIEALKKPLYKVQRITRYTELITAYAEIFEQGLVLAHEGNYNSAIRTWLPLYESMNDIWASNQLAWLITHAYNFAGQELEALTFVTGHPDEDPNLSSLKERLTDRQSLTNIFGNPRDNLAEALLFIAIISRQDSTSDALAFVSLAEYVHRSPETSRYAILRGYILSSVKSPDYALQAIDKVRPPMPYYLQTMKLKAHLLYGAGQVKEAITLLDSLILAAHTRQDLLLLKADFLRVDKQFEKSIQTYNQLIDRIKDNPQPAHWEYYYHRGMTLEQNNNWSAAERDMIAALDLSPDQPSVLNYLGYSWVDRKIHLDRGVKMLKKALKFDRHDAAIIDSIGWAYYHIGDYEKAVHFLEEAIQKIPLDPTVNDHLGDAYWQVGRHREAYYQWRRALQMSPDKQHTTDLLHKSIHGLRQL